MATAPVPAPQLSQDRPQGFPGNQIASPAPPVQDQGANVLLGLVMDTIKNMSLIAKRVPQASIEIRTINEALQGVMQKIKGSQAPAEAAAPPL